MGSFFFFFNPNTVSKQLLQQIAADGPAGCGRGWQLPSTGAWPPGSSHSTKISSPCSPSEDGARGGSGRGTSGWASSQLGGNLPSFIFHPPCCPELTTVSNFRGTWCRICRAAFPWVGEGREGEGWRDEVRVELGRPGLCSCPQFHEWAPHQATPTHPGQRACPAPVWNTTQGRPGTPSSLPAWREHRPGRYSLALGLWPHVASCA